MRYLANSRPADGVTRDQLVEYFTSHEVDSSAWDLVRHRMVTEYTFKTGDEVGVVLFLDVNSEDEARAIVDALPVVEHGLLSFEIDPLSKVANFSAG